MNIESFDVLRKDFFDFYQSFIKEEVLTKNILYYYQLFEPLKFEVIEQLHHELQTNRSDVFWYGEYPSGEVLFFQTLDGTTCSIYLDEQSADDEPYIIVYSYKDHVVEEFIATNEHELKREIKAQLPYVEVPEYLTDSDLEDMEIEYKNTRFLKVEINLSTALREWLEENNQEGLDYLDNELSYDTYTDVSEAIECTEEIFVNR